MSHKCHHPYCSVEVPPRLVACPRRWYQLLSGIRNEIWRCYRPGQEIDKDPSAAYLAAMDAAIRYWKANNCGATWEGSALQDQPCNLLKWHTGMCRHDWDLDGRGFSFWGRNKRPSGIRALAASMGTVKQHRNARHG